MSWGMAFRATIGAGLVTLFAGLIPLVFATDQIAGVIGLVVGGGLMVLSARRSRHSRGTALLAYRLGAEATRDRARAYLIQRFEKLSVPAAQHAQLASIAIGPLTALGLWRDAQIILERVAVDELDPTNRGRHLQALATCRLEGADLEGASEALAKVERPAEPQVEVWLVALEALLQAIQGNAEAALEACDANPAPESDALAASYGIVRAHALACMGQDEDAKRVLNEVVSRAGHAALERAIRPVGPASDIARSMLG